MWECVRHWWILWLPMLGLVADVVISHRRQARLRAVLQQHHQWHMQDHLFWVTGDGYETKEQILEILPESLFLMDDALEYADSDLCARTLELIE